MLLLFCCCCHPVSLILFIYAVASPLTTPEQAQQFLASMRHKSKKEEWEHRPPSNLSSDGVDAWYMMQRQREQEMRKRRQEAEQLLRGYRAPYKDDASIDTFGPWSPKSHKASHRMSMGDMMSDSLTDPAIADVRRQSTMPRLQSNYNPSGNDNSVGRLDCNNSYNDCMSVDSGRTGKTSRSSFPPERTQFLNERRHYDGTGYDKHADPTAFSNGRSLFNSDGNMPPPSGDGEMSHPYNNTPNDSNAARYIDTTESQNRLREAGGEWRNSYMPGEGERRSYGSAPGETRGHGMGGERKSFGSAPGESRSFGYNNNRNADAEYRDVESRDNLEDSRNRRIKTTRFSLENEREGHGGVQRDQAPSGHEDLSSNAPPQAAIPETVWRDFISPGKILVSSIFSLCSCILF